MDEIEAARAMGMKRSEVLEVAEVDDGTAVRTHDGQWTLVRDDGTLSPTEAPEVTLERDSGVELASGGVVTGPVLVGESGPEPLVVPATVRKRRGQR